MGYSKIDDFTEEQNKLASLAKAIAHPARIAILEIIINADSCICGDIVSELNLAQSTISQHLKALKKEGIIQGTIEGTRVCYCIHEQNMQNMHTLLSNFLDISHKLSIKECC